MAGQARAATYPRAQRELAAFLMAGQREEGRPFGTVRAKSARRWRVDVRPYGRIDSLEGVGFATRERAEAVLQTIRAKIDRGVSAREAVAGFLPVSSSAARVSTHYASWVDAKRREVALGRRSPRTVDEYERYSLPGSRDDCELDFWLGRTIYEVDGPALEEWSLWLAERGLAPKSVRNVLGAFRTFVRWLQRRGELERAPLFPEVEVPEHRPRVISLDDQARILAAIPAAERGALLVLATMGLRPGEVRALVPADYQVGRRGELGRLVVHQACKGLAATAPVGPTKTRRERSLPVPPAVADWIAKHVPAETRLARPWLFVNPRTGRAWSHWSLRASWLRGCTAAGLGPVPLYEGTKHTFASAALDWLAERGIGAGLETVGAALGHTDTRTTRRYAKVSERALVALAGRRKPCRRS